MTVETTANSGLDANLHLQMPMSISRSAARSPGQAHFHLADGGGVVSALCVVTLTVAEG